ncbi:hypothetical protein KRX56_07805 [Dermabacteraceae bacterium TAE3-ERU27]|nr:hypothetical protein [Dermabacteraceae bacterium TAE3-ERU27]
MSHTAHDAEVAAYEQGEPVVTDEGNSLGSSLALFIPTFGLFLAGLYMMGLFPNPYWFMGGLTASLVSLYIAFDLIPHHFTK